MARIPSQLVDVDVSFLVKTRLVPATGAILRQVDNDPLRVYLAFLFIAAANIQVFPFEPGPFDAGYIIGTEIPAREFTIEKHKALVQQAWWIDFLGGPTQCRVVEVVYQGRG